LVGSQRDSPSPWDWAIIPLSLVVALVLMAVPLPRGAMQYRPDWVGLVLIYWCLFIPERVGIGTGWLSGLLMDVMQYTLLGQNALSKAVLAFLANQVHSHVRMYPWWQQSIVVFILLSIDVAIVALIHGMVGGVTLDWRYWMPCVVAMLIWPWLGLLFRTTTRRVRTS